VIVNDRSVGPPLSDAALRRLRMISEVPDLSHTKYDLVEPLGHGGMGSVYLARDKVLDRLVALKVVGTFALSPDATDRLLSEAQVLARLEHPGIVPVHDVGALPDGRAFYTMKFVRGQRLDTYLSKPTSAAERLRILERLCDAVSFAHANGVIHRDLKPQNVMVGPFGEVLVMDWGVATRAATEERTVAGTPGYMAPEQMRGDPADARSDVYALGAIMRLLFAPEMSKPLRAIADRAMATDPAARYASVESLAADVARFRAALPVDAYREGIAGRAARVGRKYAVPIALVLAYLVMRGVLLLLPR
jgi:eukaryotic-like serine/threonine-protein kinase